MRAKPVQTDDLQEPAIELRRRLQEALAVSGLTVTQLARRAGLGRTTTSNALSESKPAPSVRTVAALALALRIQNQE
jgi:DNA-binding phage protein